MLKREDYLSLEGKVAVISGAAGGIGKASAQLLSAYGAKTILLDVSSKGEKIAQEIVDQGREAIYYSCDVTKESEVIETARKIQKLYGKVDVLFNNAGVTVRKTVVDLEEKEWDFVLDVGLKGTYLLSKHIIPIMKVSGGGSIINTGSGWGLKGGDDAAAYCAMKGGIVNLTRAMAIDHGKDHIRVNSVNPGDTITPMLIDEGWQTGIIKDEKSKEEYLRACGKDRPLGRIGEPKDIAKVVLFLASDLSSWMSGSAVVVDGGGIA